MAESSSQVETRVLERLNKLGDQLEDMKSKFTEEFKSLENEMRFMKMKNEKLEEKVKKGVKKWGPWKYLGKDENLEVWGYRGKEEDDENNGP